MKHDKLDKKIEYIICPNCGREYLPAEIYYPKHFFGNPQDIERLNNGRIEHFDGKSMDLEETYQCDACDCKFKVTAKVSFKAAEISKYDTSKAYVTPLFEEKLTLFEGD